MKRKILSILTSLALCLSLLPTAAFAEDHTCADEDGDNICDLYGEDISPDASFLAVGETVVLSDREVLTASGEGWAYDAESNTLTLNNANITSGYEYKDNYIAAIYADGDLNIEVVGTENHITAPADVMSRGIRAEMLTISGDGTLNVTAGAAAATDEDAESVGISAPGGVTIYEATVITTGGSATVTGNGDAYSNGIYTEGDLMVDLGGELLSRGGEATGQDAYSTGMDAYGAEDNYINIAIYDGYMEFTGGKAVGENYAGSCGIYGDWAGLYVYGSNAHVTLRSGEAESTGTTEDAYAYSNGAMIYAGDVDIDGGTVQISSGPRSGLYGDGYALYVAADKHEDADGSVYYSGGNVDIDCENVSVSPNTPSLMGTEVTISSESGTAVYAQMGFDLGDTLTISSPDGAEIKFIDGSDAPDIWVAPDYYTIVDAEGTAVQSVSVEPLGYTVLISGLSFDMGVLVPAGQSLNEAYCEIYEIEDFSEMLITEKEGYTFRGWYTDEACTSGNEFDFDDAVNSDITIYPKWTKKSSSGSGSSKPSKPEDTSKHFADVHDANHWAKDAVDFVTARGIFDGTTANTFTPDGTISRQAMWMVLARMSGEKPADMDEAKAWAVETGISDGSAPTSATSRQQFVTMLWRWAKAQGIDVSVGEDTNILSYEDAFGISAYAIPAFQWACGAGVVSGYADHTLKPEATASRAHVATMLMNFLNK